MKQLGMETSCLIFIICNTKSCITSTARFDFAATLRPGKVPNMAQKFSVLVGSCVDPLYGPNKGIYC